MKEKIKKKIGFILRQLPIISGYLRRRTLQKRFPVEIELIKGNHHNENKHPSLIHFSVNKAATQYVKHILCRCASEQGMVPVGIHEYAWATDFPYLDSLSASEMQKYRHVFLPEGYLYSVFGGMIEGISDLEKYLIVLMIRDPRDVLVSNYYSTAYSHRVPDKESSGYKEFLEKREKTRQIDVDAYVLARSEKVYSVYQRYINLLLNNFPHTLVVKYEDMTGDFQTWLKKLLEYCKLEISDELLHSLLTQAKQSRPKKEDIQRHVRKGVPGDFKEKLRPETIDYLNSKFSPILKAFEYD